MKKTTRFVTLLLMFFFLFSVPVRSGAEVLIITNPSTPIDTISKSTLAAIYQNQKTQWDHGATIKVVLQVTGETHKEFSNKLINVPPSKLRKIWKQVIFTGTGNLPKLINEQGNIVKYVSNTKGSIAYIDSQIPHETVKILEIK